jgi:transcriptional regulator with XRE-family HTH domain
MDHDRIAGELVRALRGSRSQIAFSRRLGSRCNLAYAWESGRRFPTARRFFEAAALSGIDAAAALGRFLRTSPAWLADCPPASRDGVVALLAELRGQRSILDVARATGASRFQVARWLSGQSEPRLPDFLRLVEATSYRLLDFVDALVGAGRVPSLARAWQQLEASRQAAHRSPWCHAVLRLLETEGFRARSRVRAADVARALGIEATEAASAIELLERTGQIQRSGQAWQVVEVGNVDLADDPGAVQSLKAWAASVGLDRIRSGDPGLYSYNLFCISTRDYARVEQLHRNYFRQVRALVAESSPSEQVVMLNLQLFPLLRSDAPERED